MARIQVTPRGNRHIFGAATAARNAFINTRTAGKIDHIVIEGKGVAGFILFTHKFCQFFILLQYNGQILGGQLTFIAGRANYRFHTQFFKAKTQHHFNIFQKIGILMGEGAAHIIVFALSCLHQFLKFGYNSLPTALACIIHTVFVVDLFTTVQGQNHIAHFFIGKFDHIVINEQAVGGQCKTKVFAVFFFNTAGICHQILDHLKIHQRFATKKVNLQVATGAGIGNQKVQCGLTNLKTHYRPFSVIFALTCKTVLTVQITSMGNVQAQRLNHTCGFGFQCSCHRLKGVGSKEFSAVFE